MAKVVGIGGVFLGFKGELSDLLAWYKTHLGLEVSEYGANFLDGEQLALIMFKRRNTDGVYINFRVDDIQMMHEHLLSIGCEIIQPLNVHDYGTFLQFIDPFGNPIELWEPNTQYYRKMVQQEIEDAKK